MPSTKIAIFYLLLFNKDLYNRKDMNLGRFAKASYYTVRVMGFNATFSNISVTKMYIVAVSLLVEETREDHQPAASH
jgi:hypothetical protein